MMIARRISTTLLAASLLLTTVAVKAQTQDSLRVDLKTALDIALSENPTIKIADKEVERTNYAKSEAKGGLLPTIAGVGTFSRNLTDNTFIISKEDNILFTIPAANTINGGITLNVPILSFGLYKNIQLSELNIKTALESARESKIALRNEVEKAYYGVLMSRNAYSVMAVSMKNAEDNFTNTSLKFEEGKVAEFDKLRAEVQLSNTRPSYLQAKNNVQMAILQLKMLMGLPLDTPLAVQGNLSDFEKDYTNYNVSQLQYTLENNATLKRMALQEQGMQKQLELQKTARMPYLGASFSYMFNTQDPSFNIAHYDWFKTPTVGLTLNVPIFSGFVNKNKERQIGSSINQLQLQRQYQETGLDVQIRNTITVVENAIEQIEANVNIIRQAQKAYDISKTRYDSGVGTILELNDAEVSLTQAKLNYNQAIYSYLLAKSDFVKLVGRDI